MKKILTGIVAVLVLIIIIWIYLFVHGSGAKQEISSLAILESLQNRGFLVTETVTDQQKVTINNSTGSAFKDFFYGQTITASALMKVSLGVDLAKLNAASVTKNDNQAELTLPPVEIQSTELASDITLVNSEGVLKKILNDNDGYNMALLALRQKADEAATSSPDIIMKTTQNAELEIGRLVGYLSPDLTVLFR